MQDMDKKSVQEESANNQKQNRMKKKGQIYHEVVNLIQSILDICG